MEPMREIVRAHLRLWQKTELSFVAELGVTELLTNVYKHARGACELVLSETATGLFVGVTDLADTLPVVREPTDNRADGRGLFLLTVMTDELAVEPRGIGKQVWFHLSPEITNPDGEERNP
ncbi:ATP-binding protein [Kitasatospora sp. NPDC051853]|uniref:ATP-binding protein n=1 Tax=Kitasatospora sp. NPDC051853 TaxID=3364058 RepID=UPI0037934B7E